MTKKPVTIEPEEFKQMLDHGEMPFVFDLREKEEFEAWHIEGRTPLDILNIPQEELTSGRDVSLARLPKDRAIITIGPDDDASRHTAELLRDKGINARALEGGMDGWSEFYETRMVSTNPDIYQIFRVAKGCITHVIVADGKAVVIDPVRHIEHIEKVLNETGAKLIHVFDTHLQSDHISGGRELALKYNVPYHINSADALDALFFHASLQNGEKFRIGSSSLVAAIQTPGHTPGSTSLVLDRKFIFTGNTIMPSSVGRPAFRGAVHLLADLLFSTLHERFDPLPDEVVILPSHASGIHEQDEYGIVRLTLGDARRRLPLMSILDRKQFVETVEATLPMSPRCYTYIRKVNLGLLDVDEEKSREIEIGKNVCGLSESLMDDEPSVLLPASTEPGAPEGEDNVVMENSNEAVSVEENFEGEPVTAGDKHDGNGATPTADSAEMGLNAFDEETVTTAIEPEKAEEPVVAEQMEQEETKEVAAGKADAEPATAFEEFETVLVVEPPGHEPEAEINLRQGPPPQPSLPDAGSAQILEAALPGSKELGEIVKKLAEERFDKMMSTIDIKGMLADALAPTIKESITRVLWESTPQMAEMIMKHALQKSLGALDKKLESVIWGTVPELAETIIRKEIKKLQGNG